ncbi:MAG TPA: AbrB/MazE/SpoVT family DNA-binding domain-containing protein [Bryobacteraceae bacterium]|nr:AbrB/MazE/SpoVT family DNA-binding domain-containing protein [Bryobacteraceae bacterium]
MKATVRKWGNSAALRIPAAILESAHLDLDDLVDLREERGRIVIEPLQTKQYDLARLVKGINSKNRHILLDFGPQVGHEVW